MWINVFLITVLCWSYVFSEDCLTPLGMNSSCVSLNECKALATAVKQEPIPKYVASFVKKSYCGFQGNVLMVCCGPLPKKNTYLPPVPTEESPYQQPGANGHFPEDSLLAPSDQCGKETSGEYGDRIFGGEFTGLDEFPWTALLAYRHANGSLMYWCGGSLINRRYVLTAAHCITTKKYGPLESVRLGEYNIATDMDCQGDTCAAPHQDIPVASTYVHPKYDAEDKSRRHDIAIVRLASRATYTLFVQPICLRSSSGRLIEDEMFFSGWGATLEGSRSLVKRKLKLKMYDKNKCIIKYQKAGAKISDQQICAGGVFAQDVCTGDSGGPLMVYRSGFWEEVGVASFGRGCGMAGWPGIYTSVVDYQEWIRSTLRSSNV